METENCGAADALGRHIRSVRRSRGLTLVQLASLADLSHPFLSQIERGLARPSMVSLERIARSLGSSQLELLAGAADLDRQLVASAPTLVRADDGDRGPYGQGEARLLVRGDRSFHPMTFEARNIDPGEYHAHDEDEFIHVTLGPCVIDLGGQGVYELETGDSLYYVGGTPHRWYSTAGSTYRLFIVKQHFAVRDLDSVWNPALLVEPAPADATLTSTEDATPASVARDAELEGVS